MGLNMVVGVPADADDEYAEMIRADLAVIHELLAEAEIGPWVEPESGEDEGGEFEMWGYSGLHALRRLAVHLAENSRLPDPQETQQAADDPLLKSVYARLPTDPPGPFDHLVHHSDCEGYYVPVDFERVIVDEKAPGGYVGSSVRLLAETRRLARVLELPEDLDPDSDEVYDACDADEPATEGWQRYGVESYTCLRLLQAAKLSTETRAAIAFC